MKKTRDEAVVECETLPPTGDKRKLAAMAKQLDSEIRREFGAVRNSLSRLAEMLARMHDSNLWQHLADKSHEGGFKRFEAYVESVLGPMGRTKIFDLLAIGRLSVGPNPVPPETIQRLGRVKAAEIARLDPQQRTSEILQSALAHSVPVVRQLVQDTINKGLPLEERRDVPIFWGRYYPQQVIDRFEGLEARGCYLEGIRDGDRTLTLRAKFMVALLANFETNFAEELAEADRNIAAMEAKNAQGAGTDDDEEFGPPEPEELTAAIGASSTIAEN